MTFLNCILLYCNKNSCWNWNAVKHNYTTYGLFKGYTGQLHISAHTGHLQVVLRELNLKSYYIHVYVYMYIVGP